MGDKVSEVWDPMIFTHRYEIKGRPVQFHWQFLVGSTPLHIMREIQIILGSTEPCNVKGRIVFMSMFNDIEYWIKNNEQHVLQTQQRLPNTRSNSSQVIGVSVGQDKTECGIARARTNRTEHGITLPGKPNARQGRQQNHSFSAEVGKGQYFVTRVSISNSEGWTLVCREHTLSRNDSNSQLVCALKDNVRIGPVLDTKTTKLAGLHSTEVLVLSKRESPTLCLAYSPAIRLSDTRFGAIRCWRSRAQSSLWRRFSQPGENPARATNKH